MANMQVTVVDGNNVTVSLDRGVAGVGIASVQLVVINNANYLLITYTNGTTQTVGPVGVIQYNATTPINISGSTISLLTVPVNLGGTGQTTANAGFNALAPSQASASGKYLKTDGTNSAWDALDISTADITGTLPIVNGGTGQTTANAGLNALLPAQTSQANKYLQTDGTNASWDAISLSTADITGILPVVNGGTGVSTSTGTGNTVLSTSPTLVTPVLGTPASGTLTNATGLPVATGISGLGTGIATFLATPSSANLAAALTDETGTGAAVFATSPTLVTPALGTPASGVMTNVTGTAAGLTAGNVTTNANLTGGVTSVGNAATVITNANLTGDITSIGNATTLTNAPVIAKVLTGYISGAGTVAATDSILQAIQKLDGNNSTNANLTGPITSVGNVTSIASQTGTGTKFVVDTSPTLITPDLGTPTALVGTNITGTALSFTSSNVTTNANLTGDITSVGNATAIAAGVIVNADINASAAIDDTKLATIATALKVSNSATTASSANTASAIVARDASGNFAAGTVTAALTGNASTATALATGRTIEITGDLAYTSPSFDGSANVTAAGTLATVATAGVTGSSTAIPVVTINAKGLTTSITTAAVIAPAGTLSGNTLAAGVTGSSLTSLGTIANLSVTAGTISTTPSASTDIANKDYVDTVAQGLDPKASCVAATTVNITLSGTQTIDGVALIAADRCLVKDQTAPADNGIYVVAAGAWARSADMNAWVEVPGAFAFIEQGTTQADTGWVCTSNAGGTLGTTAITFVQFAGAGSYTASTGLTLTGTAFSLTAPVTVALGGTNATSAGIASFNNITGYTAAGATGTTSTNLVFSTSPTLVTPDLGTPSALIGTNITGTATAFTASNVTTNANLTGAVTSTGNATLLGSFTSANLASALTDETGTGVAVFATSPTLVTPDLGTPTALVLTSATGLPLTTGVTGTLPVANGGTGLTTGTSGGVLAYTAAGTLASSAALAASALVIGGGAGAAPSTTTTGTGVVTALGVNTGTAGAFVVNGGALGSPSSVGTMPAFTLGGTVSGGGNQINNVIIGTTTPLAGAFTTLSATGLITGRSTNGQIFSSANNVDSALSLDISSTKVTISQLASAGTLDTVIGSTTRTSLSSSGLAVTGTLSATKAAAGDVITWKDNASGNTGFLYADATNLVIGRSANASAGGLFVSAASTTLYSPDQTKSAALSNTGLAVTGTLSASVAATNKALTAAATSGGDQMYVTPLAANSGVALYSRNSADTFLQPLDIYGKNVKVYADGGVHAGTFTTTALALQSGISLTGGISGTGYSFSGSAPANSLTLNSSGNLSVGTAALSGGKISTLADLTLDNGLVIRDSATTYANNDNYLLLQNSAGATAGGLTHPAVTSLGVWGNTDIRFLVTSAATQVMTLDSSGNLGVGATSPLSYSSKFIEVSNATSAGLKLTAGTSGLSLGADFSYIASDKSLRMTTYESTGFIRFSTQDTERARITSGGYFKASNAGTYNGSSGTYHELRQTTDETIAIFTNTSATLTGTSRGIRIGFTAASPNDTANYLLYCDDSTSLRAGFRSNGGLANFSANNSNLSDQRVKTDIQDAGGYLAKICAIPVRTFKYKDQTDELLNLGVIAQEVEAIAPELVDTTGFGETPQDGIPLKAIYQTDLQYALMKCIQEQQALITQLTARITALETA